MAKRTWTRSIDGSLRTGLTAKVRITKEQLELLEWAISSDGPYPDFTSVVDVFTNCIYGELVSLASEKRRQQSDG